MGLFIYSCSDLILPKQVEVKGTLNLPISVGAANLGSMLAEKIKNAFLEDIQGAKVYEVDYTGQTIQTFCIYLPIEITEDINPSHFLKTIDKQINGDMKAEPKEIDKSITYLGTPIPIQDIEIVDNIPAVSLADIARYVITIDFDECNENNDLAGIGINFCFTEIPDGLAMILECDELNFSTAPKPLKSGDNVFGNDDELTLALEEYKNDGKKLNFNMILQSTGSDPNEWDPADYGFTNGDTIEIKGEMRFFHIWTKAEIKLAAAIKASSETDNLTGKYPDTAIDLSEMHNYLAGGFTFNDLEVKMCMDGPAADAINELNANLVLDAQYDTNTKNLYNDALIVNSEPLNLNNYLNDNESYKYQHLPGNTSEYDGIVDRDAIADIFNTMPADLFFIYKIELDEDKVLTVYPDMFADDSDNPAEDSKITTTMMIMLPMSLTATGDNDNKSTIFFPDMFGNGDLFGREEPEDLFKAADVDYIIMTIDFSGHIFTNGNLFINKDNDLFPHGVNLNGSRIVLYLFNEAIEEIRNKLIIPDIKIKIDKDGTLNVPKNMGIFNIKFEAKSRINLGEL